MYQLIRQGSTVIMVLALIVVFNFSFTVFAQDVPPRWDDAFSAIGVDGEIHDAIQSEDGQLYIAGDFRRVGGLLVNGVARWDGVRWHALGQGIGESTLDVVYTIAFDEGGNLIAGGDFAEVRQSNGNVVEVSNLALWDGAQWESIASGVNDIVYDLFADEDGVYIAGAFSSDGANEFELNRITYWDGSSFSSVGDGLGTFGGVEAHALAMDSNGILYAAGTELSGGIFRWDGQDWMFFGAGHDGTVLDMAINDAGQIYVAGDFVSVIQPDDTSLPAARIALWNGTNWETLGAGFNQPVHTIWLDGANLYAGGTFTQSGDGTTDFHYVAQWNGTWAPVGPVNNPDTFEGVNVLLDTAEQGLLAAGSMQLMGTSLVNSLGFWTQGVWTGVGGDGMDAGISALLLTDQGELYAGGDFGFSGTTGANFIAQRANDQWLPLGQGTDGEVRAIEMASDGSVYVGGSFTRVFQTDGTEVLVYGVARWDGTVWSALGNGVNGSVETIAIDANDTIYIGGDFTLDGSEQAELMYVAQWNGTAWAPVGSGMDATVHTLVVGGGGELIAGGAFTSASAVANTRFLASWQNNAWASVGGVTELNGEVYALVVDANGILTAGGAFTEVVSGQNTNYIAQWDGLAWTGLGTPTGNGTSGCCVRTIAVDDLGTVFAGGDFKGVRQPAGPDLQASYIASWNGDNGWTNLDVGMDGAVQVLAMNSIDLFAGGDFRMAGGLASSYLARWSSTVSYVSVEGNPDALPSDVAIVSVYPNPVASNLHVQVALGQFQSIEVGIYDVLGRKVKQIFNGQATRTLNLNVDVSQLANGTYWLTVQGEHSKTTHAFVRAR